ncbi:MAG TPA: fasciclin domain-containing protein [Niastella sp.]
MNRNNIIAILIIAVVLGSAMTGCNKWKDHNGLSDPASSVDLFQQIQATPELSRFAELLTKSGYDKLIAGSQNYTVFAPVNEALVSLDPAVVNDTAKLRLFVGNHISNQLQHTGSDTVLRLPMINGKYNNLLQMQFDEATVTIANKFGKNGLLHIINKAVPALPNAWEFVQKDPLMPNQQKNVMLALKTNGGDQAFLKNVYDLSNEKKQYTFFAMADTSWQKELGKYVPFFATTTTDSTLTFASMAVLNDLAIEGAYTPAKLPDTVLSKFNTKVGIDKSAVVQTVKVSNGIVYLMRKLPVLPKHKFQPIIIQGEDYTSAKLSRPANTYIRERFNQITGKDFRDVLVFGHGTVEYYLGYELRNVPSLKYRAYWVALHDNINSNTGTFRQKLGIEFPLAPDIPYITVLLNNYKEVDLGVFTVTSFKPLLNIYLTADNNTNSDLNKITVDYIRLEPVFN